MNDPHPITIDIIYKKDIKQYTTQNQHSTLYLEHLRSRDYTPFFLLEELSIIKTLAYAHGWEVAIMGEDIPL